MKSCVWTYIPSRESESNPSNSCSQTFTSFGLLFCSDSSTEEWREGGEGRREGGEEREEEFYGEKICLCNMRHPSRKRGRKGRSKRGRRGGKKEGGKGEKGPQLYRKSYVYVVDW